MIDKPAQARSYADTFPRNQQIFQVDLQTVRDRQKGVACLKRGTES